MEVPGAVYDESYARSVRRAGEDSVPYLLLIAPRPFGGPHGEKDLPRVPGGPDNVCLSPVIESYVWNRHRISCVGNPLPRAPCTAGRTGGAEDMPIGPRTLAPGGHRFSAPVDGQGRGALGLGGGAYGLTCLPVATRGPIRAVDLGLLAPGVDPQHGEVAAAVNGD